MKSVTMGRYYASNSVIHRLDPRGKIVLAILFIVSTFLCKNVAAFAFLFVGVLVLAAVSRVPLKVILRSLKGVTVVIAFAALLNLFLTSTENAHMLWEIGTWNGRVYGITEEGIIKAVCMVVRIITLIIGTTLLLTYTMTPIELTDGLSRLLWPLLKIRVPVDLFAMMMSIALRFIPTLSEDTERIMNAQKARGANFSEGGLIRKARALVPILIPLFVSSFKRGEELAVAMECRGYHSGDDRTRLNELHWKVRDTVTFILFVALGAAVVCINIFCAGVPFLPTVL